MRRQRKRTMAEINVVPFIDVMLVLLVVFMITAPLLSQGVKVNLPQASAKSLSKKEKKPIIVSVDAQGHYFLNVSALPKQAMTARAIMTQVAAQLSVSKRAGVIRHVYVKGDKSVPYGKVVQAMVMLQRAGVPSVGLMTRPGEVA